MLRDFVHWAFLGVGTFIAGRGAVDWNRSQQSLTWPRIDAEVVDSEVEEHRGRGGRYYEPIVRYRYEHEGAEYEGRQFRFAGILFSKGSKEEAERIVAPYRPGTKITISVCPANPDLSVIVPGMDPRVWEAMLFGSVFAVIGLLGLNGKWWW